MRKDRNRAFAADEAGGGANRSDASAARHAKTTGRICAPHAENTAAGTSPTAASGDTQAPAGSTGHAPALSDAAKGPLRATGPDDASGPPGENGLRTTRAGAAPDAAVPAAASAPSVGAIRRPAAEGPLFILPDGSVSHAIPLDRADMQRLRLVLLDFDGTLADTREANYRAYARTLAEAGVKLTREAYLSTYFGMRSREFLERIGFGDPAVRERLRLRKIALYPSCFDTLRLNRPLWAFAQEFRAAGGRVWIVSTGSRDNIRNAMRHLGIAGGIDGMLTGEDVARSKPAPDSFLRAMAAEGAAPHETLIFEDSAVGLEAARRSGAPCIAVKF